MKLNKKFFGVIFSFGFFLYLGMVVSAMENIEKNKTPIEYVVMEKEEIKSRVEAYCKIKFVLKKFNLFDDEAKDMALLGICAVKMEDLSRVMNGILKEVLQKKIYNDEDRKNITEKARKCLMDSSFFNLKITENLFKELKGEIKEYMLNKINRMSDAIEKAKNDFEKGDEVLIKREIEHGKDQVEYLDNIIKTKGNILADFRLNQVKDNKKFYEKYLEEIKKQTRYGDEKKKAYKESVAEMEKVLERFNLFLAKIEVLQYEDFEL